MTNYFTAVCPILLLNLGFDQWDEKADKCEDKEGFFHEEELFICKGGFPGIFDEVEEDFLRLFDFLLCLEFLFIEIWDFLIGKINSLPINVIVMDVASRFSLWFVVHPTDGFQRDCNWFVHFFYFLFL